MPDHLVVQRAAIGQDDIGHGPAIAVSVADPDRDSLPNARREASCLARLPKSWPVSQDLRTSLG